jgi:phosphate-selective porin OprO and OprP
MRTTVAIELACVLAVLCPGALPSAAGEEAVKPKELAVTASKPLRLSGYINARYRDDPTIHDGFDLRRARLVLRGDLGKGFDFKLQAELAGSAAKLLDAALGWRHADALKVTAGQFKIPFSQENLISSNKLETVNRSQVVEALVARGRDVIGNQVGRDIGVMASGTAPFGKPGAGVDYALGVFNGSGINTTDTNDRKDLVGRVVVRPVEGLSIGGSGYSGRFTLPVAPDRDDLRRRVGGEIAYQKGPWLFKGEYISGTDAHVDREGWYAMGCWFAIPSTLQAVAKYDAYDPNTAVSGNQTSIATLGANVIFSPSAFVQLNYERKDEAGAEIANDAVTVQLTLQF